MRDVDRCLTTAHGLGVVDPRIVHGAQNLVLVAGDRVLRFPRHTADAERIDEISARHAAAFDLGLVPHPPVRTAAGPVGTAHLELVRVAGAPLPQILAGGGQPDLDLVAESLTEALAATRRAGPDQWPFPQRDWVRMWAELPHRAEAHAGLLPPAHRPAWLAAADRAAVVARAAPLGLMHGDLQGHNVLVTPDGRVSAVLDWDSALIGDPAMDAVAALHDFPAEVRARVVARHDWLAADLDRFAAYRATWELQAALWRVTSGPSPTDRAGLRRPV